MHFTGKVLNQSGSKTLDVKKLNEKFAKAFEGLGIKTDINFTEASSVDDIDKSDHVIAQVDDVADGNGVSTVGGKVAYVEAGSQKSMINSAIHEGGHMLGLGHKISANGSTNFMDYPRSELMGLIKTDNRSSFSRGQVATMISRFTDDYFGRSPNGGYLNRGSKTTVLNNIPSGAGNFAWNRFSPSSSPDWNARSNPRMPWKGYVKKGQRIISPINDLE